MMEAEHFDDLGKCGEPTPNFATAGVSTTVEGSRNVGSGALPSLSVITDITSWGPGAAGTLGVRFDGFFTLR